MCLAVPVRVIERRGELALVEIEGVGREVSLLFVPEAREGDYVLLHAGFAIQRLDEEAAAATLRAIDRLAGGNAGTMARGEDDALPD